MTKTELKTFRKALEYKQAEVGNGSMNREDMAIETSPDVLDRMQQAGDRDYAIDNFERNSNWMREVRAALRRIDEGAFGICADCGETINPKRLAEAPWNPYCIVCQAATDHERAAPAHWFDSSTFMAA
jgi:DnaK suppressor protein